MLCTYNCSCSFHQHSTYCKCTFINTARICIQLQQHCVWSHAVTTERCYQAWFKATSTSYIVTSMGPQGSVCICTWKKILRVIVKHKHIQNFVYIVSCVGALAHEWYKMRVVWSLLSTKSSLYLHREAGEMQSLFHVESDMIMSLFVKICLHWTSLLSKNARYYWGLRWLNIGAA